MTTRVDEIAAACRALARVNRRRDGWEPGIPSVHGCAELEHADIDDVHEVQAILVQLAIDPRAQYRADEIRALVLTDALAESREPTPFEIEAFRDFSDPFRRRCE